MHIKCILICFNSVRQGPENALPQDFFFETEFNTLSEIESKCDFSSLSQYKL